MSKQRPERYTFDGLPLDEVAAGSTLLVAGRGRLASKLAQRLVLAGQTAGEGAILVSTNTTGRALADNCVDQSPDPDADSLGIVDATGRADAETDTGARIETVSSTADLTGISIRFSVLYSSLYEKGFTRVRTSFDSLSMLLLYTNPKTITRFVHAIAGRVSATDGFCVFVIDPSMHDSRIVYTLEHLCDGRIDVRGEEAGDSLQVSGLPDQPAEWTSVDLDP